MERIPLHLYRLSIDRAHYHPASSGAHQADCWDPLFCVGRARLSGDGLKEWLGQCGANRGRYSTGGGESEEIMSRELNEREFTSITLLLWRARVTSRPAMLLLDRRSHVPT